MRQIWILVLAMLLAVGVASAGSISGLNFNDCTSTDTICTHHTCTHWHPHGCTPGVNCVSCQSQTCDTWAEVCDNSIPATISDGSVTINADTATTAGYATTSGSATTAGYATTSGSSTTSGYATTAGNSDKVDGYHASAFVKVGQDAHVDNVYADDLYVDDIHADDISADDINADDIHADDITADDINADDIHADDVHADDVSADDINAHEVNSWVSNSFISNSFMSHSFIGSFHSLYADGTDVGDSLENHTSEITDLRWDYDHFNNGLSWTGVVSMFGITRDEYDYYKNFKTWIDTFYVPRKQYENDMSLVFQQIEELKAHVLFLEQKVNASPSSEFVDFTIGMLRAEGNGGDSESPDGAVCNAEREECILVETIPEEEGTGAPGPHGLPEGHDYSADSWSNFKEKKIAKLQELCAKGIGDSCLELENWI